MQPSISQSDKFKEDYARYQAAIDKTNDLQLKTELRSLLNQLVTEVKAIDSFYNDLSTGSGIVSRVEETRSTLTSLRKELEKRIAPLNS